MADEAKVEEKAKAEEKAKTEEKPKASEKAKAEEKPSVELSDKLQKLLEAIEGLTVLEMSSLVKAMEDKFGISAAAPMAVAAVAGGGAQAGGEAAEEKTAFDVVLTGVGDKKIQVIKEIRSITSLGLKEAKDLVESAPKPVKQGVTKEEADKVKETLEKAGATVEIK